MEPTFEEREREYWNWLTPEFAGRLSEIRTQVERVWTETTEMYGHLKWYTPHGSSHFAAVEDLLHRLIPFECHEKLSEYEKFLLLASAWLHDLGMLRGALPKDETLTDEAIRDRHHIRTWDYLSRNYRRLGVQEAEIDAFGLLSKFHRRRCPILECPRIFVVRGRIIRLRLLAAYLRLADALHVDQTRAPTEQYSIMLTYDIPASAKLHWLRSRFVDSILINPKEKVIEVFFRKPPNRNNAEPLDDHLLCTIYDQVTDDLTHELNSVKDVLIRAGISYFIEIRRQVIKIDIVEPNLRDFRSVFNYYFLLDNPSSSALSFILISVIEDIIKVSGDEDSNHRSDESAVKETIYRLLRDVEESVLSTRRCHVGLARLAKELREANKKLGLTAIHEAVEKEKDRWVKNRQAIRKHAQRCFDDLNKLAPEHGFPKELPRNAQKKPPKKPIDILLYGYSEQVVKALCGFRDAAIFRLLSSAYCKEDPKSDEPSPFHKEAWEQKASRLFRIFVCEGQPKNRNEWGGRPAFHDGVRYSEKLREHGFTNIYLIPDAVAASIVATFDYSREKENDRPDIDYIIVGANGFDNERFRHSAGHTMVIAAAHFARDLQANEPKIGPKWPLVVLAASTDKYEDSKAKTEPSESRAKTQPSESGGGTQISESGAGTQSSKNEGLEDQPVIRRGGWIFRDSFAGEPVRSQVFVPNDPSIKSTLGPKEGQILLYNPREDSIPMAHVDVVITEKTWLYRWEVGEQWGGRYIHKKS